MEESEKDQRAILETLCAYVRQNSRYELPSDEDAQAFWSGQNPPRALHRVDVQTALTIIGRRGNHVRERTARENWRLDLRNSNLIAYDFSGLNFDRADFGKSFLNGGNLSGASFDSCIFADTFLRATNLAFASFHHAIFEDTNFSDAKLNKTDFRWATFIDTDLREAAAQSFDISSANLERAFGSYFDHTVDSVKKGQRHDFHDS